MIDELDTQMASADKRKEKRTVSEAKLAKEVRWLLAGCVPLLSGYLSRFLVINAVLYLSV